MLVCEQIATVLPAAHSLSSATAPLYTHKTQDDKTNHLSGTRLRIAESNASSQRPKPGKGYRDTGMWISTGGYGIRPAGRTWLWLDPLLFPEEELLCRNYIKTALKKGAKNFVLKKDSMDA